MATKRKRINVNKLVIASHDLKSNALRELANELTDKLGYKVLRVKPNRIFGRKSVLFKQGIDKVQQFRYFKQNSVSSPAFSTTLEQAKELPSKLVVVRTLTNASEGRGIHIVEKEQLTQHAPLYTEYIPKKKEYRVHVFNNKVIDVQEKRRKLGGDNQEFKVRNTANGYVFCRNNVEYKPAINDVALAAVSSIGATQGAVDVVYNEKKDTYFALEVNQRPGLQGTTLKKYANAIVESLK